MIELNCLNIVGRLTRDPEIRTTSTGMEIVNFSIAVNRRRNNQDNASFFDCKAFGKTATFIDQWFEKGKPILLRGRLEQERWDDRNTGQKRSKVVICVEEAGFASDLRETKDEAEQNTYYDPKPEQRRERRTEPVERPIESSEDLPF